MVIIAFAHAQDRKPSPLQKGGTLAGEAAAGKVSFFTQQVPHQQRGGLSYNSENSEVLD